MTWKLLKSKELFTAGFFRLRQDECELPDGRIMPRYYVMEFLDWVNVVAITAAGELILVEQYRHAAADTFLEIPGGGTEPNEDPAVAAARELREETGYVPGELVVLGHHFPNPALQNNRMHTILAVDCRLAGAPQLDPYEDLRTVLMPARDVYAKLFDGEIKHSLIAASLTMAYRGLRERGFLPAL